MTRVMVMETSRVQVRLKLVLKDRKFVTSRKKASKLPSR